MANLAEIYKFPHDEGLNEERREFMSDKGGFVKNYRSIDKQPWSDDPICMLVAQYLIRNAAFNDIAIEYRGNSVSLSPGQFVTTQDELSVKSAVYNFYDKYLKSRNPKESAKSAIKHALKTLEEDGFLTVNVFGKGKRSYSVITLPNYVQFNSVLKPKAKPKLKPIETHTQQGLESNPKPKAKPKAKPLNKNDINNKDLNTPLTPQGVTALFDVFWKCYPKKSSKPTGRKAFDRLAAKYKNKSDEFKALVEKIINHVEKRKLDDPQWTKDGGQFIPMPSTFLNQERWNDEYTTGANHEINQHYRPNQFNQQHRPDPNNRYSDAQAYLESRGLAGPRESAGSTMDEVGSTVHGSMEQRTWESW